MSNSWQDADEVGTVRVVIAPDSFKGSIAAASAARAIAAGWRSERPSDELIVLPQADGGEGTLDAIFAAVPGSTFVDAGRVAGPDGRSTAGFWLLLPDGSGVVELAQVSGLPLMERLSPLTATTRGLGAVISAGLDAGVKSLTICLGGSASTDGGSGALAELGLMFLDPNGHPIPDGGEGLGRLAEVNWRAFRSPPPGGVRLLVDVDVPLLGRQGSATTFGPQKGATAAEVKVLERGLSQFSNVMGHDFENVPGAGSAGGAAFGFMTAWSATLQAGAPAISELTGLNAAIEIADVLVTGEGHFDQTSSQGKVVGNALSRLHPTTHALVIAGQIDRRPGIMPEGLVGFSLTELAGSSSAAMAEPQRWLHQAGREAALRMPLDARAEASIRPPNWHQHRFGRRPDTGALA